MWGGDYKEVIVYFNAYILDNWSLPTIAEISPLADGVGVGGGISLDEPHRGMGRRGEWSKLSQLSLSHHMDEAIFVKAFRGTHHHHLTAHPLQPPIPHKPPELAAY